MRVYTPLVKAKLQFNSLCQANFLYLLSFVGKKEDEVLHFDYSSIAFFNIWKALHFSERFYLQGNTGAVLKGWPRKFVLLRTTNEHEFTLMPCGAALVQIRAHSWLKKNTSRYAQIRGDFSVFSWIAFPSQVRTATFFSSVWKNVSRKGAKGRRVLCPFVLVSKIVAQKYTETLLRMLLRKSAPSAWDNYPRRMGSVCSVDSVWDPSPPRKALCPFCV